MTFSEKLITLRAGRDWSQERLARELGITRQAVGSWEKGSGLPDAKSLMALARVFGVEAEWLLDAFRLSRACLGGVYRHSACSLCARRMGYFRQLRRL